MEAGLGKFVLGERSRQLVDTAACALSHIDDGAEEQLDQIKKRMTKIAIVPE